MAENSNTNDFVHTIRYIKKNFCFQIQSYISYMIIIYSY